MRQNQPDRVTLPAVLITVGILWLLIEIGFVPAGLVAVLANWWPLFLVGAGLDLMVPARRPANVPFVAIAAAIVLLLGVFAPGGASTADGDVREALSPGARSVTANVRTASAPTTITGARDAGALVEASFIGQPAGRVTTTGGREPRVEIRPVRTGLPFAGRGRWHVGLPAAVPLSLTVDSGTGALSLDLNDVALQRLDLEASSGAVTARLPGAGASYTTEIDGGSGRLALTVAPGASVDMEAEFSSGGASMLIGEGTDLRLELKTGSGGVDIDLPDTAPIRLEVRDDGSGRLRVPGFLNRRSGSGDTGVWESRNLGDGGRVIEIRISDVGSGNITLR